MDIGEILQSVGGLGAIASQLGISPDEAQRGAAALLPSVLHGFGQHEQSSGGGLGDVLSSLGGAALQANVVGPDPTDTDKGNSLLGHIFGSKDVSRDVATQASQSSGVSPDTLKKMLPILAMLVGGYLASQRGASGSGGLGGVLGPLLSGLGGGGAAGAGAGGLGGALGSVLGSFLGR